MLNDRISLTPEDILDKEFKIDARGYRPQEVDKYLDTIMSDYTEFLSIIHKDENVINGLSEENKSLKAEIRKLNMEIETLNNSKGSEVNNVDLLRRISKLEKVVFGQNE